MKKILVTLAAFGIGAGALGLSATGAMAQMAATPPASFSQADADNSESVTFAEAQVVLPGLTQEQFEAADISKDGTLDQAEFDALATGTPAPPSAAVKTAPNNDDKDDAASPNSPNAPDDNNGNDNGNGNNNGGGGNM